MERSSSTTEPGHYFERYICNPLTKEWLKLPRIPLTRDDNVFDMVGFICDYPYCCDKEKGFIGITNAHYRYKVVHIESHSGFQFELQMFSSETGEWCNLVVSLPTGVNLNPFDYVIMCLGKLVLLRAMGCCIGWMQKKKTGLLMALWHSIHLMI